jgi:hypothetical protein
MARIYISGPMKGYKDSNIEEFKKAHLKLLRLGYEVTNPFLIINSDETLTYQDYMRFDIRALTFCDSIYMLKGWEQSKGANIELTIARAIGLKILYE